MKGRITDDLEYRLGLLIAEYEYATGAVVSSVEIRRTHPRVTGDDYDFVVRVNVNGGRP